MFAIKFPFRDHLKPLAVDDPHVPTYHINKTLILELGKKPADSFYSEAEIVCDVIAAHT